MAIGSAVCAMLPERMRIGGNRYARAGSAPSMAGIRTGASSARPHNGTIHRPEAQDCTAPTAKSRERVRAQFPTVDHAGAHAPTGAPVEFDAERVVQEPEPFCLHCRSAR